MPNKDPMPGEGKTSDGKQFAAVPPDVDPGHLPPEHGLRGEDAGADDAAHRLIAAEAPLALGNCQTRYLASGVWGGTCQYLLTPYDTQATWDPTYNTTCDEYGYCRAYCQTGCVHCAIDVSMNYGTPLYAIADATIKIAGNTGYYTPLELLIQKTDGSGVQYIYGHCSKMNVSVGQAVKQGQLVAWSGYNASNHLHFEKRVPDSACSSGMATVDPTQDCLNYQGGTTPPPSGEFNVNDRVKVTAGPANFRTGPGTSYSIIEVIANGGLLCVTSGPTAGGGYTWYGATYQTDGKQGYLVADLLSLDAAGACGTKLKTTANVNVRTGPNTTYPSLGVLASGTTVSWDGKQATGGGYTWDECTTSLGTGWIANAYLTTA